MIKKIFQSLIILFLFVPSLISDEFSVMTLNVDNLFDTKDDKNKDDKAYLPIELKQSEAHKKSCNRIRVNSWKNECLYLDWNEETKNAKKLVAEGVEGMVPFKGNTEDVVYQLVGGLKSSMGYTGHKTIKQMQGNCKFVFISKAGARESDVHDVIT